jgi:hypothetical protein
MFNNLERVEEPRAFQQTRDITEVAAPSSMISHLIVCLEYSTWIWKATWYGKRGFTSMMSNLITFEPLGSRAPKAESKAFLYDGNVWSTSKADIAQGAWPRSSTIE